MVSALVGEVDRFGKVVLITGVFDGDCNFEKFRVRTDNLTGAEYVDAEYEFEFEFEFEFGNELDLMGLIERDGEMVCPAPFCLASNLFKVAAVSLGIGLLVVVVVGLIFVGVICPSFSIGLIGAVGKIFLVTLVYNGAEICFQEFPYHYCPEK